MYTAQYNLHATLKNFLEAGPQTFVRKSVPQNYPVLRAYYYTK
jgi:hypothetical protein